MVEPISDTVEAGPTNDPGGLRAPEALTPSVIAINPVAPTSATHRGRRRNADDRMKRNNAIGGLLSFRGELLPVCGLPAAKQAPGVTDKEIDRIAIGFDLHRNVT
jgi:hypothetical protein